jgi:hypothetical protein
MNPANAATNSTAARPEQRYATIWARSPTGSDPFALNALASALVWYGSARSFVARLGAGLAVFDLAQMHRDVVVGVALALVRR